MNDLISRQSVKNWLAKWEGYIDHDLIARMQCRVIDIPSAQSEQRWIPCSERLPEDNGNYLVTYIYKDDEKGTDEPYAISDMFLPWKGAFATEEPTDKAQAWMPLPDPWEEEDE